LGAATWRKEKIMSEETPVETKEPMRPVKQLRIKNGRFMAPKPRTTSELGRQRLSRAAKREKLPLKVFVAKILKREAAPGLLGDAERWVHNKKNPAKKVHKTKPPKKPAQPKPDKKAKKERG
jgi:hypothetical protein